MAEGTGLLVLTRPWPGMARTLYGDDERFVSTYFERFGPRTYLVGDAARRDGDGYFWIIGRTDDVINVSGHRLSTAEVESAIVAHPKVAESAVVAESRRADRAGHRRVRDAERRVVGNDEVAAEIREYVGEPDRQAGPAEVDHLGRRTCRRPAPARSCAGCCATSPRGGNRVTSRRWATRRSCGDCRRRRRGPRRRDAATDRAESVLVVWSEELLRYDLGATHPMAPGRLEFTMALARDLGCSTATAADAGSRTRHRTSVLQLVHDPAYVAAVRAAPGRRSAEAHDAFGLGSEDNPVFDAMHEAAALVTGATLAAAQAVRTWRGTARRQPRRAGCTTRCRRGPRASASTTTPRSPSRWLLADGVERVAYVDVDAHHGDGVEAAFIDDPRVLTISLHESGYTAFPGTGYPEQPATARRRARRSTSRCLRAPATPAGYARSTPSCRRSCEPSSRRSSSPSWAATPIASTRWRSSTSPSTRTGTRYAALHRLAHEVTGGRWVAVGGGGYEIVQVVPRSWTHLLAEISGRPLAPTP